jgi:DNA-binding MarR family transcriptional regulator
MLTGTDVFIAMWSMWSARIPKALVGENPDTLLRLIRLADAPKGVSQGALQRELQISQSKVSKVTAKLVEHKWLEVLPDAGDRRFLFVRTSQRAKNTVISVEAQLASLLPRTARSPRRRRGLKLPSRESTYHHSIDGHE